jgi:predicted dehydrogenase
LPALRGGYGDPPPSERRRGAGLTRRALLGRAAAAAAAPYVLAAAARGADGAVAPSSRITLGFIGVGMMGRGHVRCCVSYPEAQVLAVCDVDRWRREDARNTVETAYAERRAAGTYRGCEIYNDLRKVLARRDVDAVLIATGDRWHALATVMAAAAGKDVYCEKPASLTVAEAVAMVEAIHRYGRVFQTGLQQRTSAQFRKACALVQAGAIGRVRNVYVGFPGTSDDVGLPPEPVPDGLDWDLWLGPAPWRPFNGRYHIYGRPPRVVPWDFCRDFGGGNLTSNAVHAFDVVQWGLGMDGRGPVRVEPPETGRVPSLTYTYPGDITCQVTWRLEPGKHAVPPGWDPATQVQNFGALFAGDDGWIHVGRQGYLAAHPASILDRPVPAEAGGGVPSHHQDWLDCIRTRGRPASDVVSGCGSAIVAHLGCIAHWTGRALAWDPVRKVFPDDEGANRWLARPMRSPWAL